MVCASVYAVFIAVDGVALGIMVDRWAEAGPEQQELLYETAFAVRQIEGGLFRIQWLMFGIAAGLFAGAFFASAERPFRLTPVGPLTATPTRPNPQNAADPTPTSSSSMRSTMVIGHLLLALPSW